MLIISYKSMRKFLYIRLNVKVFICIHPGLTNTSLFEEIQCFIIIIWLLMTQEIKKNLQLLTYYPNAQYYTNILIAHLNRDTNLIKRAKKYMVKHALKKVHG